MEDDRGDVLTTNEEKMHIFENIGIDYVVECPFTEEIRNMDAVDFIRMMVEKLHVKYMVVGTDFHFGHNRMGDYRLLLEYADKFGYEVQVIEKIQSDGRDISSTYIREYIKEGNIEKANELLGYSFFLGGISKVNTTAFRSSAFFSNTVSKSRRCPLCIPSNFPNVMTVDSSILKSVVPLK